MQFGSVVKRVLEQRFSGDWQPISTAFSRVQIPFLRTKISYVHNDDARLHSEKHLQSTSDTTADVLLMFHVFHDDVLIGHSELESGDPPMGVASGRFEPTDAFAPLRKMMKPARDGLGKKQHDIRYLDGLGAKKADGFSLPCYNVEVFEYGDADNPFAWEVFCNGIEYPLYGQLFPRHVKAYYGDQFKK